MKSDDPDFEQHIKRLLADPSYRDHPLYIALACLWQTHREQLTRLERITSLSDAYQALARSRELSLSERFDKQVRQLEKVVRISDRYQEMMRDLNLALKEASTHDALTGLPNRRLLLDRLKEETERYTRNGHTFVLAMLDVDYFKQVNDRHGHDIGDKVLQAIARTMQAELREYDVCGRWGGEEFLFLLPETDLAAALTVITRVHQGIRDLAVRIGDDAITVTCSIGIAEHRPEESFADTLNRADSALLDAKREGRDRLNSD